MPNVPNVEARRIFVLTPLSILALGLVAPLVAGDEHVSGTANGEWRYWGGDERSSRYSPLAQINAESGVEIPAPTNTTPMTYRHNGKQYIVASVAGEGMPAEHVALTLAEA